MSDTINLAGKDIIVDHVTTQDGGSGGLSLLQMMNSKRNRNGVDGITAGTCRIGARASGTTLEIYAYNPLNSYSSDFGDDYYVNTGYVDCNGQSCPVFIPGKHISFPKTVEGTPGDFYQGTWAIMIHKQDPLDEVWSVEVAIAEPDNSTPPVIQWKDSSNSHTVLSIDTSYWVIGFFTFSSLDGVYNLFVNQNGTTPMSFLKDRFMQVMNDCDGVDTDDFSNWATAMKCDAIFKRLAALEILANNLIANNLNVGPGNGTAGSGFRLRARTYNSQGQSDPLFDIMYGDSTLFQVDVSTGIIYFGTGFWYDPSDGAIHSNNDNVVIDSGGGITAIDALIKGSSVFKGSFDCDVIKTEARTATYTDYSSTRNDARQASSFRTTYSLGSGYISATLVGVTSSVKFVQITSSASSSGSETDIFFYDQSLNPLDIRNIISCSRTNSTYDKSYLVTKIASGGGAGGQWATSGFTLRVYSGGNLLTVSVPSQSESGSLTRGQLYYASDGTIKMKL